jgi:hypothetical protein
VALSSLERAFRYGQVSFAIPVTAIDMAPMLAEFADAIAFTSTVPEAPGTHCAKPDGEMVAIFGFDTDQLPE